jgi:Kef-type K+ transport system membrane component KefB
MHDTTVELLVTVGGLLLAAPWLELVAQRTRLPRVSLLLLLGLLLGPVAFDVLPENRAGWYSLVSEVTLALVGFLLGGEFTAANLKSRGRPVLVISAVVSVVTLLVVALGLWALGVSLPAALVLGTAATATDPAAVDAVMRDTRSDGAHTRLLRGVVAVDDVWGLLLFGVLLSVLSVLEGAGSPLDGLLHSGWELVGSIVLGGVLGVAGAQLLGRLRPGEATRLEAVGGVLLSCGLAQWLELSYLLTAVSMGAAFANTAQHAETTLQELERQEAPFLVLFFVLSGASAVLPDDPAVWTLVGGYVLLRTIGRLIGGWLGVGMSRTTYHRGLGISLLPQAGVALGMTLVAVDRSPSLADQVLPAVVLGTLVFELVGPVLTRRALVQWGETQAPSPPTDAPADRAS